MHGNNRLRTDRQKYCNDIIRYRFTDMGELPIHGV